MKELAVEKLGKSVAFGPVNAGRRHLVVVGGGQSAKWLLFWLCEQLARDGTSLPLRAVTVVESQAEAGTGLAWNRENVLESHLASRSIAISRWTFGDKQREQFRATIDFLREMGVAAETRLGDEVVAIEKVCDGFDVLLRSGAKLDADHVVLATGYGVRPWRGKAVALQQALKAGWPGAHSSPWPATGLQRDVFDDRDQSRKRVLVLGTYLTAVDAVITLATRAGRFTRDSTGRLSFEAPVGFSIAMASRTGLLPKAWGREDASAWKLRHFTKEALLALMVETPRGAFLPLDAALDLVRNELAFAARHHGDVVPSVLREDRSSFQRLAAFKRWLMRRDAASTLRADIAAVAGYGPLDADLSPAQRPGWQVPVDRVLALWAEMSPWFSAEDAGRFDRELRSVFFNHMLPMPLASALHLDAMFVAGHLKVVRLGRHYELNLETLTAETIELSNVGANEGGRRHFTDVVDATGHDGDLQRSESTLVRSLLDTGMAQPALRRYRHALTKTYIASAGADQGAPGIDDYMRCAGIYVNPKTCEVIPKGRLDFDFSHPKDGALYAIGPNLGGQFADAQSIGQADRDARRVISDLVRRQSDIGTSH